MLPTIIADTPLNKTVEQLLAGQVNILPWSEIREGTSDKSLVTGVYTFGHPMLDGPMMDLLPNLKMISNHGVGVDHINVADATERGIIVGNTPNVLNGATADMAFTLLLAGGRRLCEGDRYARSPQYTESQADFILGQEIHSTTIGIVGLGRIGLEIARRAKAFNMRILYHNRNPAPERADEVGAEFVSLDGLLAEADYVVLVCPMSESTRGLISNEQFQRMKPTAVLVNIARGGVVDTEALTVALRKRQIYHAALDVTDPEPLPRDHPLLRMDNVTIAPHLGSATEQTRKLMAEKSVENLLAGLRDEPLFSRVN